MIEQIESIGRQLQLLFAEHREALEQRHIDPIVPGSVHLFGAPAEQRNRVRLSILAGQRQPFSPEASYIYGCFVLNRDQGCAAGYGDAENTGIRTFIAGTFFSKSSG